MSRDSNDLTFASAWRGSKRFPRLLDPMAKVSRIFFEGYGRTVFPR